jgi:hypothetical protein
MRLLETDAVGAGNIGADNVIGARPSSPIPGFANSGFADIPAQLYDK